MSQPVLLLKLLVLLGVANGGPVLATRLLGQRLAWPLDGGAIFRDGRPLFGASKTVRGVVVSLGATSLAAPLLGMFWGVGALLSSTSLAGDLLASFLKRRLGLEVHARAFGLDQVPEALLPLLVLKPALDLGWGDIAAVCVAFLVLETVLSKLLFRLHIRDRPY